MNKTNLELKHYCTDFAGMRKILKKIGARKEPVIRQVDYFFSLPKKEKSLNARLKLRTEGKKMTLIYYERPASGLKAGMCEAKLYRISDRNLLPFLQKTLGVEAIVDKKREIWRKSNTVFHIDTVKGVGGVFEIELQKKGTITEKDKQLFAHYQKEVLPYLGNAIKGSNVDLVEKK